ncbi:hypothetical protein BDW74DRAFT_177626 [Aspergillus multicolor]|uniref:sulfotransferase family protein n=1 Tax=Aspergillus multicolor TaxID=41759 RepID=UPI003CCE270A
MATTAAITTIKDGIPLSERTLAEGGGVLVMGLPRSGTYSVAHALKMLGHERVFHNIDVPLKANDIWGAWFRPMWACKPFLRQNMGLPYFATPKNQRPPTHFTRADWDDLVGRDHQVIADMSVYFVKELLEAYPDAQVILWQRDFDSWYKSYTAGVIAEFVPQSRLARFARRYLLSWSNVYWHMTVWYGIAGWLGADNPEQMRENAKLVYREHFETVRKLAKPGKLLEYRLGDGWGPLCEFLGCEVPDAKFPHLNEASVIKGLGGKMNGEVVFLAVWNFVRMLLVWGFVLWGLYLLV